MRRQARASLFALLASLLAGCSSDQNPPAPAVGGMPSGGGADGGRTYGGGSTGGANGATGGVGTTPSGGDGGRLTHDEDATTRLVSYEPSQAPLLNPERGFYATASLVDAPDLSKLRASGVTLVHSYVRLDDYRTSDLPDALLMQVSAGFEKVRQAGVKVILRFAYNFGPYPSSEPDAPQSWVLKHIAQLKPLLASNRDVIAVVQAGFIGAWGEWHTSTNGLTEPAARKTILETLLDAVPAERSVQLRYPPYKRALYGDALTTANAFGATYAARTGHHNDCFVSSANDVGTYPDDQVDFYRDYVGADSAFVPVGGETCAVSPPRSECASALSEMEKLHFSYINREFHEGVLASWAPCQSEMDLRLGYRLQLTRAQLPERVKPGGSFVLTADLENTGFAAPFNARPVFLVLQGSGVNARVQLPSVDPRRWLTTASLRARVRLPSALPPGRYTLGLWLPDAAENLSARSDYALRLTNPQAWDEGTGVNQLGPIDVRDDAAGTAAPDVLSLTLLGE